MNKILVIGAAICLVIGPFPRTAKACSCGPELPPGRSRTNSNQVRYAKSLATAVFAGEVIGIASSTSPQYVDVRLRVDRIWKGSIASEVTISTAIESSECGYRFLVGRRYLVYCHGDADHLETNICLRTKPTDDARVDLHNLGRSWVP